MADSVHFLFATRALKQLKKLPKVEQEKFLVQIRTKVYRFLYHNDRMFMVN